MAAAEGIKVLSSWFSMFGMKVLIALNDKGVEYEYVEQDLSNKSQLLLQSNPIHKKVPVLIHNGKPICESLVIVQYIDEAWPSHGHSILPSDPYKRALARFWADYVDKKVYDATMRILKSPEEDVREQGKKDFKECMVTLDGALRDVFGGGAYFGGEKMGLVDMTLAPFLCWLEAFEAVDEVKLLEEEVCPQLSKWAERVAEHPSVKVVISTVPLHKIVEAAQIVRKPALATAAT